MQKQFLILFVCFSFCVMSQPEVEAIANAKSDPIHNEEGIGTSVAADEKASLAYQKKYLFGEAHRDKNKKLLFVKENKNQKHERRHCAFVHVRGFKPPKKTAQSRIRVAVWNKDTLDRYGQEGMKPFRASSFASHEATPLANNSHEMIFQLCGLSIGENYSFFAHHDENNSGKVNRFMGIPTEDYVFSNTKNQAQNPNDKGLFRDGLKAPDINKTWVRFSKDKQKIYLNF